MVFIAHPMSGDLEGNTQKVVAICRKIHSKDVIPVSPSFTTRRYLTADPTDRMLAKEHINEYFERHVFDELWLFGDRISEGMMIEVNLAIKHGIPVVGKTPETVAALEAYFKEDK
jgi:hypothetical protein